MSSVLSPKLSMRSEESGKLLSPADDELDNEESPPIVGISQKRRTRFRMPNWVLVVQSLLLFVVTLALAWVLRSKQNASSCQVLYSPAQEAIVYEATRWTEDVWTPSIYKAEPSEKVDRAWADLYNDFGISQIPKWQADLLPNRTLPIPADPEYYIVQLSVFHQLHCLNTIRKALSPNHYVDPVTGDLGNIKQANLHHHLGHCIDGIRQGLMCAADVSPIIWEWSDYGNRALINMDVVHSCRNYDMVIDWAKAHKIKHHFDWFVQVDK